MSSERIYAGLLLGSVAEPAARVANWLVTSDGPPPIDLRLMASALVTAAHQLAELAGTTQDGAQ